MTEVWIAQWSDDIDNKFVGVFSTKEKAIEAASQAVIDYFDLDEDTDPVLIIDEPGFDTIRVTSEEGEDDEEVHITKAVIDAVRG